MNPFVVYVYIKIWAKIKTPTGRFLLQHHVDSPDFRSTASDKGQNKKSAMARRHLLDNTCNTHWKKANSAGSKIKKKKLKN